MWLRVAQYGWTVERIATAATILIALCYAFGYAAAAVLSLLGGAWMRLVARVNVVTAFVVLAVLLAMFTPLGDPARLAVNSQVARLKAGTVPAATFDYDYLKAEGGRYGRAALGELAAGNFGADTALVRKLAKATLDGAPHRTCGKPTQGGHRAQRHGLSRHAGATAHPAGSGLDEGRRRPRLPDPARRALQRLLRRHGRRRLIEEVILVGPAATPIGTAPS